MFMPYHFDRPHREIEDERERRRLQTRLYRRNQAIGVLLVAAAILLWRLFHTPLSWIFPAGWWRP
jgi:hypothetical protein